MPLEQPVSRLGNRRESRKRARPRTTHSLVASAGDAAKSREGERRGTVACLGRRGGRGSRDGRAADRGGPSHSV